jgi:hypothetical protein
MRTEKPGDFKPPAPYRIKKRGGYSGSAPKVTPKPPSGPAADINPKPQSDSGAGTNAP